MSIINLEKVSLTLNKLNIIQDITFSLNKKEVISILGLLEQENQVFLELLQV